MNPASTPEHSGRSPQMDLFAPLMRIYASGAPVCNDAVYRELREQGVISHPSRARIGKAGELHDPATRKVRWWQQTAKQLGLIEKVPGERGVWRATEKGRARPELTPAPHSVRVLGFSTELGLAIWGEATDVFRRLDEPVHLVLSSLPYPLARGLTVVPPSASMWTGSVQSSSPSSPRWLPVGPSR